ncbi:iron-binding protein [Leptospira ognonensis]|uniref:Iron-binding protein n=1 Tax=Leptospira ognonensis TaxID=2484945 RepID=A0A4R9JY36_9LEPT|nr:CDGSH iron-sulfur domain-containing protein [Leptospira ognonensis]TGL56407.1 iron-binding protein [Leptospira ognonensis]
MEVVKGKKVTILFDAKKCIHSRSCVLDRPDVFVPNVEGEWIYPDRATPDEVAMLALNCPSGAIRYERHDGVADEKPPIVNTVRIRENGPLALRADAIITGQGEMLRATLCRCGASGNKPFCDGSHTATQFQATGEAPLKEFSPLSLRNGKLTVTPAENGPLLLKGNLEVVTGTGKTINKVTQTAFCRCGASSNKPYCDGSHAKIGFKS